MTSFDNWLQALAAAGKGGAALGSADIPTATRGLAWSMPIALQGNWIGGTIAAAIRAAPDAATALVTPTVTAATYDAGTGFTTWTASFPSGTTFPGDVDGDGTEAFPISFLLTPSGGTQQLLIGGAFILAGKV